MSNIINKALMAGLGAASLSREKLEALIDDFVKRGEVSYNEKQGLLSDLLESVEKRRTELKQFVQKEVKIVLKALDVPTREEVNIIKKQVERLENEKPAR